MEDRDDGSAESFDAKFEAAAKERLITLAEALAICDALGKELQGIGGTQRKATITRIRNKAKILMEADKPIAATMFAVVAGSWEDFSQ